MVFTGISGVHYYRWGPDLLGFIGIHGTHWSSLGFTGNAWYLKRVNEIQVGTLELISILWDSVGFTAIH